MGLLYAAAGAGPVVTGALATRPAAGASGVAPKGTTAAGTAGAAAVMEGGGEVRHTRCRK